jgi:hypothetical protein
MMDVAHQEGDQLCQFGVGGFDQNAQHGILFGVVDEFNGVIGRKPAAFRHQLMHPVGGALGLHDANIERQVRASEQLLGHVARMAEARVERVILLIIQLDLGIVEEQQADVERQRLHGIGHRLVTDVRAHDDGRLAGRVTHAQHGQHVPVIERRRCCKEGQRDLVVVRNDGEQDIGMKLWRVGQRRGKASADVRHGVHGQLQHDGYHLVVFGLGDTLTCKEHGKLPRQNQALGNRAIFDHVIEDAGIESKTGFVFQGNRPTFGIMKGNRATQDLRFGSPRLLGSC